MVCRAASDWTTDVTDQDLNPPDDYKLQDEFIRFLEASGVPWSRSPAPTNSAASYAPTRVLPNPAAPAARPVLLPYPLIGTLFKGRGLATLRNRLLVGPSAGITQALSGLAVSANPAPRWNMLGRIKIAHRPAVRTRQNTRRVGEQPGNLSGVLGLPGVQGPTTPSG